MYGAVVEGSKAFDVIIIGAGPTGLAAAIHSATFGLNTFVLDAGEKAGGIAIRARGVKNYPGFLGKTSGLRLMEKMACQAKRAGAIIQTSEEVMGLSLKGKVKVVKTKRGTYSSKALILAAGAGMKGLGMKWETWIGDGVAYCEECGAPFFNGKDVIVVGGANEAVEEALHLTKIASSVRLVNHANTIAISDKLKKQLKKEKIGLIEDFVGEEIKGSPPSKRLVLRQMNSSMTRELKTNMIFVVGGIKPFVSVLREAGITTHRMGCVVMSLAEQTLKGFLRQVVALQQLRI